MRPTSTASILVAERIPLVTCVAAARSGYPRAPMSRGEEREALAEALAAVGLSGCPARTQSATPLQIATAPESRPEAVKSRSVVIRGRQHQSRSREVLSRAPFRALTSQVLSTPLSLPPLLRRIRLPGAAANSACPCTEANTRPSALRPNRAPTWKRVRRRATSAASVASGAILATVCGLAQTLAGHVSGTA